MLFERATVSAKTVLARTAYAVCHTMALAGFSYANDPCETTFAPKMTSSGMMQSDSNSMNAQKGGQMPHVVGTGISEQTESEDRLRFQRYQFSVLRSRGKIFIDGIESNRPADEYPEYVKLIQAFDGVDVSSQREFLKWAKSLRGKRTYTFDTVVDLQNEYVTQETPIVLLNDGIRSTIDPAWHQWLANERQRLAAIADAKEEAAERQELRDLVRNQNQVIQQLATTVRSQQTSEPDRYRVAFLPVRRPFYLTQVSSGLSLTAGNGFLGSGFFNVVPPSGVRSGVR